MVCLCGMVKNTTKETVEKQPSVIDFGQRKIANQNFSKLIALPKMALTNCSYNGRDVTSVDVQLVQKGDEKFIKLIPRYEMQKGGELDE